MITVPPTMVGIGENVGSLLPNFSAPLRIITDLSPDQTGSG